MRRPPTDLAPHDAWALVMRVAVVVSLLSAAAGATIYRFAGGSPVAVVAVTAIVGLGVGWTLPAARPLHRPGRRHLAAVDQP